MGDRIILDGGMGTMLQARGLKPGDHPEIYGMEHPEIVAAAQMRYNERRLKKLTEQTGGENNDD